MSVDESEDLNIIMYNNESDSEYELEQEEPNPTKLKKDLIKNMQEVIKNRKSFIIQHYQQIIFILNEIKVIINQLNHIKISEELDNLLKKLTDLDFLINSRLDQEYPSLNDKLFYEMEFSMFDIFNTILDLQY